MQRQPLLPSFIVWLCFLLALAPRPATAVAALTADDLLIVFNQSMPQSRAVAEHYAAKRQVPAANLIGLDLPDSESMERASFDTELQAPLKKEVTARQRQGSRPAILLVYGVPLKVGPDRKLQKEPWRQRAEAKVNELAAVTAKLTDRLAALAAKGKTTPAEEKPPSSQQDVPALLERAERLIRRTAAGAGTTTEAASIIIRLIGLVPLAPPDAGNAASGSPAGGLAKWKAIVESRLAALPFTGPSLADAGETAALVRVGQGLLGELRFWHTLTCIDPAEMTSASVDSELTLLLAPGHLTARWLPNPFLPQFDPLPGIAETRSRTVMVARLDGPTPATAMRLVDDSLATEKTGLRGVFYIDARGKHAGTGKADGYTLYDEHLRTLQEFVKSHTDMKVVFDDSPELLEGPLADAALYCGWYALADYRDVFAWRPGAVGFHMASAEAATLHRRESNVWCKRMLEEGVAATLGPVEEPYIQAFPRPDLFFPLLMSGRLTLIETYYRTIPSLSWRMVLIGDPLYRPFQKNPATVEANSKSDGVNF